MEFSNDQLLALKILKSGKNCFVHGDAGTGKSTVIEHFSYEQAQNGKKVGKCAFTGLATMHLLKRHDNETVATINTLFEFKSPFQKQSKKTAGHIANFDIIIIDEISTCTALYFVYISQYIQAANEIRKLNLKPKIQLIVCGDFYQLSPFYDYEKWIKSFSGEWEKVIDVEKKQAIIHIVGQNEKGEPKLYSFDTKEWNKWDFNYLLLTENHRQSHDIDYQNNLKIMRESHNLQDLIKVCDYFNSHCYKRPDTTIKPICLFWKNETVENKNTEELYKLNGDCFHYQAAKTGELSNISDEKFSTLPIVKDLYLKNGAQVIFTYNDSGSENRRFANGDLATVVECNKDYVKIKLHRNGNIITLYFDSCGLTLYKPPKYITKPNGKVEIVQEKYDGEIYQFPLKLAYALTIYKAQGQTFENVDVCYDGKGENILYVAMSRARTINNLFLLKPIHAWQIKHSTTVEKFYNNIKDKNLIIKE